ncbi:hypothetical protein Q7P37_008129 [Cladosporium fusiforme]
MAQPKSILILGAGELGDQIISNLANHPARCDTELSVLLRPATISAQDETKKARIAKIAKYRRLGISIIIGDIAAAAQSELSAIFKPFHTVIGCTGMEMPPGTQTKIARAALDAHIPRFFPWQFGLDYDVIEQNTRHSLFSEQVSIRNLLRAQKDTKWVIVSTGMFLSFLFRDEFGLVDLEQGRVAAIGSWENTLTVTAVEDIGRVVSELIYVTPDENGVVHISGDSISMQRLVTVVEDLLGKKIEKSVKTVKELEEELARDPDNKTRMYRTTFASGLGTHWDSEETYTAKRGLKTISVAEWAQKSLA